MTTVPPSFSHLRVLLFGLECQTTRTVLERLVTAGVTVPVVCLPGPPSAGLVRIPAGWRSNALPFVEPSGFAGTVARAAAQRGVDVWRVGDLGSGTVRRALGDLGADALVVACYNRLIPETLYAHLPFGGLNLHPSLLPDKRGPDPLFWVFHAGDRQTGATVHRLSDSFDAGDIMAQTMIDVEDGATEHQLDSRLAELGATLVLESLGALATGALAGTKQDERRATWAPHPDSSDWILQPAWSARRAFNFVRGVGGRGHPIVFDSGHTLVRVDEALCWLNTAEPSEELPEGAVALEFSDGTLITRVTAGTGAP